jgi:large conductance mechanosensitive channel
MSVLTEFKEFAMRGNVIDMAVGVMIGGAFGKIVASLVDKVVMPPLGLAMNRVDFSALKIVLQERDAARNVAEVAIGYGEFLNTVINFLIVAVAIFAVVKVVNQLKRKQEAAPPPPPVPTREEVLLTEIRDVLRART